MTCECGSEKRGQAVVRGTFGDVEPTAKQFCQLRGI